MTLTETGVPGPPGPLAPERRRALAAAVPPGDRLFRTAAFAAGSSVLVVMALIGLFLVLQSRQAFDEAGASFFVETRWEPGQGAFGIAAVLLGTVLIALVALVVAVPVALGAALYISEYASPRARRALVSLVDLMAAVPSIVYGLWGFFFLMPRVLGLSRWLSDHLAFLPFFEVRDAQDVHSYTGSTFIAGLTVSLMIVPICTSLMREVFSQAPVGEREAAYALGSTRWGMIRTVVLPFGRGGIIGASMLGLGRALGETIAVLLVITQLFTISFRVLEGQSNSVSALIAARYAESTPLNLSALMAAGLTLFAVTLVVNVVAATVIARSRSGAATDA